MISVCHPWIGLDKSYRISKFMTLSISKYTYIWHLCLAIRNCGGSVVSAILESYRTKVKRELWKSGSSLGHSTRLSENNHQITWDDHVIWRENQESERKAFYPHLRRNTRAQSAHNISFIYKRACVRMLTTSRPRRAQHKRSWHAGHEFENWLKM